MSHDWYYVADGKWRCRRCGTARHWWTVWLWPFNRCTADP
jgi:hypothetical protein